jgi:formiminotetrahydrofolate cyclodeaminase
LSERSIWSDTLAAFRERAGGPEPVPAGVALSAVTASLAVALIAKVLGIVGGAASPLLREARRESDLLARLADDDVRAFNQYMECVRRKEPADEAMREAIRVPLEAARAALRGIDLCREATALCPAGLTKADLDAAASLLGGAARAMLLSVEANLGFFPPDDSFRCEVEAHWPGVRG